MQIPIEHEVTSVRRPREWWELSDLAGASGTDPGVFVMQGLVKRNGSGPDSPPGDWIEAYWPEGKYGRGRPG